MIFDQPKTSLSELENTAKNISFDSNFYKNIYAYLKELSRHYIGIMMPGVSKAQEIQAFPIYVRLTDFYKEQEALIVSSDTLSIEKQEIIKEKLVNLIQDLIFFITENGIEDKSIGDVRLFE